MLREHQPTRILVVEATEPGDQALLTGVGDAALHADLAAIDSPASAAHYILGTVPLQDPDETFSGYTAVAAGWLHTCAIGTDHSIECWGNYGTMEPPEGKFCSVSTTTLLSCGIRTTGSVVCWGPGAHDEIHGLNGRFTAVAAGVAQSCAIRTGRTMLCWRWTRLPPPDVEIIN